MRKKQDGTTQMLSRYVPKMYAYAIHNVQGHPSVKEKLEKLMSLWESQKYFDENAYKVSVLVVSWAVLIIKN